jgi:hypothetical protein
MALLAGILRTEDLTLVTDIPVADASQAVNRLLARYQEERDKATSLFVAGVTTEVQEKYKLGGVDEGQQIGPDGRPLETRVAGEIEVAYPWYRFGWALGWNLEDQARMTVADLDRNVSAQATGNLRRHTREILRALFGNANYTFADRTANVMVRRLANNDGTLYEPLAGTDTEAQDNHYLVFGYVSGDISPTNNPLATLKTEITEHFASTGTVVAFINDAQRADIQTGLTNFVDVPVSGIRPAPADAQVETLQGYNVPGEFIGVDGASGVYVYVWNRVPANYIVGGILTEEAPLKRRIPPEPSLQGFKLEADESHDPLFKRTYRDRFGYGAANRLSFAIGQLKASGTYDVPSEYA